MIYSVVGTHTATKTKAIEELKKLYTISRYIYSEEVGELESLVNAVSLFGDVICVSCVSLMDTAASKEELIRLLPEMEVSSTIFIIDEPFADVHKVNRLNKVSKKLYDAREEKTKDTSVFDLCDAFLVRDKKALWLTWMSVRDKSEGEAIQGALWWKFQMIWSSVLSGRRGPYTKDDCEKLGGELLRSTILAHRGEIDLKKELERILLSI